MKYSLFSAGAIALCATTATAVCPNITVASSSNVTLNCTINAQGKADIDIVGTFVQDALPGSIVVHVLNGQPIGAITIDNQDVGEPMTVELRGATPAQDPAGIESITSITGHVLPGAITLEAFRIAGDLGAVSGPALAKINNMTLTGSIVGPMTLSPSTSPVAAAQLTGLFVGGDLTNSITVRSTGLPSSPFIGDGVVDNVTIVGKTLPAGQFRVGGTIDNLSVGELGSLITGQLLVEQVSVGSVVITNANGGTGNLNGAIRCADGPSVLVVEGDMNGTVFTGSSLAEVVAGAEWQFKTGGINGQITIGAFAPFTSSWAGQVNLGPSLLAGPEYPETSAVIGGGAVGLVPFTVHDENSMPAGGSNVIVPPSGPNLVVDVEHYGPVTFSGGNPVIWERRTKCNPGNWVAVPDGCFTTASNATARGLLVSPTFVVPNGYEYRVRPITSGVNQLESFVQSIQNAPITDYAYTFTTGGNCPEDIDGSGTVDLQDLQLMLFAFGTSSTCPLVGDFNFNNEVDLSDLQGLLFKFGTDCSCTASATGGGGSGATGTIATACGFDCAASYLTWRGSLTPTELRNHLADIPAILAGH